MARQARYPQELRERAVHMVFEHQGEHRSRGRDLLHRGQVRHLARDAAQLGAAGRDR